MKCITKVINRELLLKCFNDPLSNCEVYKEIGCSHVDGFLCDVKTCSLLKKYKEYLELFKFEQELDIPFKLRHYQSIIKKN